MTDQIQLLDDQVSVVAVGDIMLDRRLRRPRIFYHYPDVSVCGPGHEVLRYPFTNTQESVSWLQTLGRNTDGIAATSHASQSQQITVDDSEDFDYPFRLVHPMLHDADIAIGNLECPLTLGGRRMINDGAFAADPRFAGALARAGFRVLSLANNHCFDFGEPALRTTIELLESHGIQPVGVGGSLAEARRARSLDVRGTVVAFLGYTMIGPEFIYATDDESGAAPLNPLVVGQDIETIRSRADVVIVTVHWGAEMQGRPSRHQRELARTIIDCGADAILGHHSHVPGGVEFYNGRPILYSLGNCIFGHDHQAWKYGLLARLNFSGGRCLRIDLTPLRGAYQPQPLTGADSLRDFVSYLQQFSYNTRFDLGATGISVTCA